LTFLSCRSQNTGRQRRFTVTVKQITCILVRYGNIFILFSVHTITEARQYAGLERGRWIFQPGHLTWYSAATGSELKQRDFFDRISSFRSEVLTKSPRATEYRIVMNLRLTDADTYTYVSIFNYLPSNRSDN